MRAEISEIQRDLGTTTIYVTHDQIEALTMGTRIAVMRHGVLQQTGPPQDVYERPANLFVATFLGSPAMNLFKARVEIDGDRVQCVLDQQRLTVPPAVRATYSRLDAYAGRDVAVGVRPEHIADPAFTLVEGVRIAGEVRLVEALGSERLVHLQIEADPVLTDEVLEVAADTDDTVADTLKAELRAHRAPLVARVDIRSKIQAGERAEVLVDPTHLHFFDLESGHAIA
jgi:multiple sugar transport system ATP-binding protein